MEPIPGSGRYLDHRNSLGLRLTEDAAFHYSRSLSVKYLARSWRRYLAIYVEVRSELSDPTCNKARPGDAK
jgi:hypothetical protein